MYTPDQIRAAGIAGEISSIKEFLLIKPYSIWTFPISQDAVKNKYIAKFTFEYGLFKEFKHSLIGISINDAHLLIKSGFAIINQ